MEITIDELDLSVRSYNCLKRAGINTIEELIQKDEEEMMKVRNLGRKSLEEVQQSWRPLDCRWPRTIKEQEVKAYGRNQQTLSV